MRIERICSSFCSVFIEKSKRIWKVSRIFCILQRNVCEMREGIERHTSPNLPYHRGGTGTILPSKRLKFFMSLTQLELEDMNHLSATCYNLSATHYCIQYVQSSALRSSTNGPEVPLIRRFKLACVVSLVEKSEERYVL